MKVEVLEPNELIYALNTSIYLSDIAERHLEVIGLHQVDEAAHFWRKFNMKIVLKKLLEQLQVEKCADKVDDDDWGVDWDEPTD